MRLGDIAPTRSLGYGIIGYRIPGQTAIATATAVTPYTFPAGYGLAVTTDALRLYRVRLLCSIQGDAKSMTVAARWLFDILSDGVSIGRVADTGETRPDAAGTTMNVNTVLTAALLWRPTTGSHTLLPRATRTIGAATATLTHFDDPAYPYQLWVEDVGLR
jgi:hypothetical protein